MVLIGFTIASILIIFDTIAIRIDFFLSGATLSLIICILYNNRIKLIKDESNRKVIIKVFNCLCFPKMKLILDIENTHFYIENQNYSDHNSYRLYIINDYKNLVGIDLDESNIKKNRLKCFIILIILILGNIILIN